MPFPYIFVTYSRWIVLVIALTHHCKAVQILQKILKTLVQLQLLLIYYTINKHNQ